MNLTKSMLALAVLSLQPIWINWTVAGVSDAAAVQNDIRSMHTAVQKGDVATLLGFANPDLIATMGGEPAGRAGIAAFLAQAHEASIAVESLEAYASLTFIEGKTGRRFVVVPIRTVMAVKDQRIELEDFMLGIKEPAAERWTYIDGSGVKPELISLLFPDFPPDYTFPLKSRRKL